MLIKQGENMHHAKQHAKTWRSCLSALLIAALAISGLSSSALAQARRKTFVSGFEVTIRNRADLRAPLMVAGQLTIHVAPNGEFSGQITPGKDQNGNYLPTVLFRSTEDGLAPAPDGPQSLEVTGSVQNHAINLALKLPGEGKYIFGSGTALVNLTDAPGGTIDSPIAGSATGPEPGDSGDWLINLCVKVCVGSVCVKVCL
jgi:hypothetical protein